jgi:hypothetical protein
VDEDNAGIALRGISLVLGATSRLDFTFDLEQRVAELEGLAHEAALKAEDDEDDEDDKGDGGNEDDEGDEGDDGPAVEAADDVC